MEIIKTIQYAKKVEAPHYIYHAAKIRIFACLSALLVLTMVASYY